MNGRPNIVLVHGAWADGSCWSEVIELLQKDGFSVRAPSSHELPLRGRGAVAAGARVPGRTDRSCALDERAQRRRSRLRRGFGLDEGESLGALLSQGPVTPALAHLFTDGRGFGWLSEEDFVEHFAADVDRPRARVMWAVQQALASSAFTDVMGPPAWKSLPTWYLVAQNDEALPPDAERQFAARMGATAVEIPASHVAMVSHPTEVAQLIEQAAQSVGAATAR